MSNFIQTFLLVIFGLFFLSWLFSKTSGWSELSKKYKAQQYSPTSVLINQKGAFEDSFVIRTLNIGVSEEGLYLSSSLITEQFTEPLLIPWDEISYSVADRSNDEINHIKLKLGNPQITSLKINYSIIKKLEEDYSEPIFSNKLGELS